MPWLRPFELVLMVRLVDGGMLPPLPLPAAECLREERAINYSSTNSPSPIPQALWATCRPWPPLDCECGGIVPDEELTQ